MPISRVSSVVVRFFAVVCVASLLASPSFATWSQVWSDEFNGTALDPTNWTADIGTGCPSLCGWGNNELEYYRSQNVTVAGGNLVLTAKAESYGGASFTSGKVTTSGKRSFLYGRIEMRAKLPVGGGMWPAFWMMPQDDVYGSWAASGEIDIMESANAMTSVGGALHYGGQWPTNTSTSSSTTLGGASFADDFHIYAVEWEPDAIRWYVDGSLFSTRTSAQWYSEGAPSNPRAPFDQDFSIILNAAVGGEYTGCTNAGCVTASFPQQYLIDYVRVYQDIPNLAPTVAVTSPQWDANPAAGDVTFTATASDPDGSIATVEFYDDATLLGSDSSSPYAFTWMSVPDGCYTVKVRAIDDLGAASVDSVDITVGAGCGQVPYPGNAFVFPARIEAEDFDFGGEGVAYHDLDPLNNGSQYRPGEGVDIEACSDTGGGYNIGWLNPGEWMEYTVDIHFAGQYTIETRVSSLVTGGAFHLAFDGVDQTGQVIVPATTGWQTWTTVTATVDLDAGTQVMRFVPATGGFNVNAFVVLAASPVPNAQAAGAVLHPCYPNPFNPTTTIGFDLQQTATVPLAVYDLAGRRVRTLLDREPTAPGRHDAVWNGRDEAGRLVPAGVYLYRLQAGDFAETRRMVLVK